MNKADQTSKQPAPLTEAEVAKLEMRLSPLFGPDCQCFECFTRRLIAEWRAMKAQIKDLQSTPVGVSCEPHVFEPNEGGENCRLCGGNWRESMHRTAGTETT